MKKIIDTSSRVKREAGKLWVTPVFQVMIRKAIFRLRRKDSGDMDVMKSSWILEAGLIAKSQDSES